MKTVILESFRDESTGELGLGVVGMPRDETTNAAADGLQIAHDLIEHVNGVRAIGSIDDELEALGAVWYVRGQHGELRRDGMGSRYSVHESIAGDIVRMFADFFNGAYVDLNAPRTRACDADEDLREIIQYALQDTRGEVRDSYRDTLSKSNEIAEKEAAYIAVCLPRMRTGYRKAKAKYEKRGRYAANNLFWEIAEAVSPYARRVEYEGAQFTLAYGFDVAGNALARCHEYYEDTN